MSELIDDLLKQEGLTKLNKYQIGALQRGLLGEQNFFIVTPTATGKTLMAKIAAKECLEKENPQKVIIITPTKALNNSTANKFRKLADTRVYDGAVKIEKFEDLIGQIMIFTIEKFLNVFNQFPKLMEEIGLVVIDELHFLAMDDRGMILNSIIANLRTHQIQENYKFRIIGMSATIDNITELAKEWDARCYINTSSDKDIKYYSVTLNEDRFELETNKIKPVYIEYKLPDEPDELTDRERKILGLTRAMLIWRKKIIVFCYSKTLVKSLVTNARKILGKYSIEGHHADLGTIERKRVERALSDENFDVVFSTSTLIYGMDFNFDTIILTSSRFGTKSDDNLENTIVINQAVGRIGRRGQLSIVLALGKDGVESRKIIDMIGKRVNLRSNVFTNISLQEIQQNLTVNIHNGNISTIDDIFQLLDNYFITYESDSRDYRDLIAGIFEFLCNPIIQIKSRYNELIPNKKKSITDFLSDEKNYDSRVSLLVDWNNYVNKKFNPDQFFYFLKCYKHEKDDQALTKLIVESTPYLINQLNVIRRDEYPNLPIGIQFINNIKEETPMKFLKKFRSEIRRIYHQINFIYQCIINMNSYFDENIEDETEIKKLVEVKNDRQMLVKKIFNLKLKYAFYAAIDVNSNINQIDA